MKKFRVSSTNGHLIANSNSGIVIECNSSKKEVDYLPTIERIDVARFKSANKLQKVPKDIDILRLAFWTKDGKYELPAEHYEIISTKEDYFNRLLDGDSKTE